MSDVEHALECINTGKWLQLEGSVGRWADSYLESEQIIVDEERTKKEGTISFIDGYGMKQKQPRFKIDWDMVDELEYL